MEDIIKYRLYADDKVVSEDEFSEYPEDYSDDYETHSIPVKIMDNLEEIIYDSDFQFKDIKDLSEVYSKKYKIPYIIIESIVYSMYDNLDNYIGLKD